MATVQTRFASGFDSGAELATMRKRKRTWGKASSLLQAGLLALVLFISVIRPLFDLKAISEGAQVEVTRLSQELSQAKIKVTSLEAEKANLETEVQRITFENIALVGQVSSLEDEMIQIKAEKADLETENAKLEQLARERHFVPQEGQSIWTSWELFGQEYNFYDWVEQFQAINGLDDTVVRTGFTYELPPSLNA